MSLLITNKGVDPMNPSSNKPKVNNKGLASYPVKLSMGIRIFILLTLVVITMVLGVIAVLIVSGSFSAGIRVTETLISNELIHTSSDIRNDFGRIALQVTEYSKMLSEGIQQELSKLGLTTEDLNGQADMLETVVASQYNTLYFNLLSSKSSGAFFILDATVNPKLIGAEDSKTGLYIKNMEPNVINYSKPTLLTLRGFPALSRKKGLALHAQWTMEFNVSQAPYYSLPIKAANENKDAKLSQLYYWSAPLILPNTSEVVMLISAPLIDNKGKAYGVCGFEISSMLFKLAYSPNTNEFKRLFSTLTRQRDDAFDMQSSIIASAYPANAYFSDSHILRVEEPNDKLNKYTLDKGQFFSGMHMPIHLYPEDSVFADDYWVVAIMSPSADIVNYVTRLNTAIYICIILLFLLGLALSLALSRRFIRPISRGIDMIKSEKLSCAPKTRIPEIDDLIVYLLEHRHELVETPNDEKSSIELLDNFLERVESLTPAEYTVFSHYARGYSAKEIADILYLSINTIKTHSKRIYSKLNVNSREELVLYVNMLSELGLMTEEADYKNS